MIFLKNSSRLGNQLFLYAFASTIRKGKEKIFFWGFDELFNCFENLVGKNISLSNRMIKIIILRFLFPLLSILGNLGIINIIEIEYEFLSEKRRESDKFNEKKGLISSLRVISKGYFQSEVFFDKKIVDNINIKKIYKKKAEDFLANVPNKYEKVFIHIRRGDYKQFNIWGKKILLPINYYKNLINHITIKLGYDIYFVFLSDDASYVKEHFSDIPNKIVSENNHFAVDLAIMSLCVHGILSISTFSWWGAYLMPKKGLIYAPKYWLGINDKIEAPKRVFPSFAIPVEIEGDSIKIME